MTLLTLIYPDTSIYIWNTASLGMTLCGKLFQKKKMETSCWLGLGFHEHWRLHNSHWDGIKTKHYLTEMLTPFYDSSQIVQDKSAHHFTDFILKHTNYPVSSRFIDSPKLCIKMLVTFSNSNITAWWALVVGHFGRVVISIIRGPKFESNCWQL